MRRNIFFLFLASFRITRQSRLINHYNKYLWIAQCLFALMINVFNGFFVFCFYFSVCLRTFVIRIDDDYVYF